MIFYLIHEIKNLKRVKKNQGIKVNTESIEVLALP